MSQLYYALFITILLVTGCSESPPGPPTPRPVAVLTLAETDPGRFDRVTGTVASWKTDELGFEVDGRVEFVIELENNIAGQVYDEDERLLSAGTLLARLDSTRYELAVASAKAQVAVAEQQRVAANIEYAQVIPAKIEAATAQRDLAQIEVERNTQLAAQNAAAQRAVDISKSTLRQNEATLTQLEASRKAKAAEVASLDAKISELEESQRKAERDLEDCQIFSSFSGQVADVHVIPGSVVKSGQPVVTVQMMDPIKVEIEVAAATARRLNHRDLVTLYIPQLDGSNLQRSAFIYTIDPVADPQTRTFTVTLMFRNEIVRASVPADLPDESIARASLIGKVFDSLPLVDERYFVDEKMLNEDADGFFLWKILDRQFGTPSRRADSLFQVAKVRVTPGDRRLSFLGLASLRQVNIADDADFDSRVDLIAGGIAAPTGDTAWDGDVLLYDRERWLVRPGDLVGVDQRGSTITPGLYVPVEAIMEQSGATYVFAVNESPDGDAVRRIEVSLHDNVDTLRRIEAVDGQSLAVGARVVAAGAAFLVDGEEINVAKEVELVR